MNIIQILHCYLLSKLCHFTKKAYDQRITDIEQRSLNLNEIKKEESDFDYDEKEKKSDCFVELI